MSLRTRLDKLERQAESVRLQQALCSTCMAPIPSVPETVLLGEFGIYAWKPPCAECSGLGGEGAIGFERRAGALLRPVKAMCLTLSLKDWYALHGCRSFGQPYDRFLDCVRQLHAMRLRR